MVGDTGGKIIDRKAFVISPIGAPGSGRRKHADKVYDNIIKPAVARVPGLRADRGEQTARAGEITDHIVEDILNSHLLLAVYFEDNGNVFYEVGVAHSAARPLIQLRYDKYVMPFDLGVHRNIAYSDKDINKKGYAERPGGVVDQLYAALNEHLGMSQFGNPFGRENLGRLGGERMLSRFRDLSFPDWSRMLLDAEEEIWVAGVSLHALAIDKAQYFHFPDESGKLPKAPNCRMAELLAYAVGRGVNVNVVTMDPENPALGGMLLKTMDHMGTAEESLQSVCNEIRESQHLWAARMQHLFASNLLAEKGLSAEAGRFQIISVRDGIVPQRITLTEREVVTSPFFSTTPFNSGGPAVRASAQTSWHNLFRAELDLLAKRNRGIELRGAATG